MCAFTRRWPLRARIFMNNLIIFNACMSTKTCATCGNFHRHHHRILNVRHIGNERETILLSLINYRFRHGRRRFENENENESCTETHIRWPRMSDTKSCWIIKCYIYITATFVKSSWLRAVVVLKNCCSKRDYINRTTPSPN